MWQSKEECKNRLESTAPVLIYGVWPCCIVHITTGVKLNRSDNVLHLVVTPDGLNKGQPGFGFGLRGAPGVSSTFRVSVSVGGLSSIRCQERPDFAICFHWSGNHWYQPRLAVGLSLQLQTHLLVTEEQLTLSRDTGTKPFIISKRFYYIIFYLLYSHFTSSRVVSTGQQESRDFFVCSFVGLLACLLSR